MIDSAHLKIFRRYLHKILYIIIIIQIYRQQFSDFQFTNLMIESKKNKITITHAPFLAHHNDQITQLKIPNQIDSNPDYLQKNSILDPLSLLNYVNKSSIAMNSIQNIVPKNKTHLSNTSNNSISITTNNNAIDKFPGKSSNKALLMNPTTITGISNINNKQFLQGYSIPYDISSCKHIGLLRSSHKLKQLQDEEEVKRKRNSIIQTRGSTRTIQLKGLRSREEGKRNKQDSKNPEKKCQQQNSRTSNNAHMSSRTLNGNNNRTVFLNNKTQNKNEKYNKYGNKISSNILIKSNENEKSHIKIIQQNTKLINPDKLSKMQENIISHRAEDYISKIQDQINNNKIRKKKIKKSLMISSNPKQSQINSSLKNIPSSIPRFQNNIKQNKDSINQLKIEQEENYKALARKFNHQNIEPINSSISYEKNQKGNQLLASYQKDQEQIMEQIQKYVDPKIQNVPQLIGGNFSIQIQKHSHYRKPLRQIKEKTQKQSNDRQNKAESQFIGSESQTLVQSQYIP